MTLTTRRVSAFAIACGLAAAAVAGCGSGQQSQTATQKPAINGTSGGTQYIALRDVQLQVNQTGANIPVGEDVPLVFVATNQSADKNDKLVSITSPVGSVKLAGDTEIEALKLLIVSPAEAEEAGDRKVDEDEDKAGPPAAPGATTGTAMVTLSKPVSSGLTYDFTFEFEQGGKATLSVPVTAATDSKRAGTGGGSSHGGGH